MQKPLDILFEDNHLLVINKPAPLATMGVQEHEPSLLKLAKLYIKEKYDKPGNVYLGVVSRLDAFVTGAIVFARTSKAASRLSDQMRRGTIKKNYWGIIPGELPEQSGSLENWIYKNESKRRMFASDHPRDDAKLSKLEYRVLSQTGNRTLLEILLKTGRKHQIRVQFSHLGTPIIGDRKYDSSVSFPTGIALHCRSLQFEHPTNKTSVAIDCPVPVCWNIDRFGIS